MLFDELYNYELDNLNDILNTNISDNVSRETLLNNNDEMGGNVMNKFKQYCETHNINNLDDKHSLILLMLICNGHVENDNDFYNYGEQIDLILNMYETDYKNAKYCLNMGTNHIDIFDDNKLIGYIFYDVYLDYYFDYRF